MKNKIFLALIFSLNISFITIHAFSDTENNEFKNAISYMQEEGIINGYEDGTFKPENEINRAEFTKIIVSSLNPDNLDSYTEPCFSDIKTEDWYLKYVCYAKEAGIINGYKDGTFLGAQNISIVESAKIISIAFNIENGDSNLEWFSPYISGLEKIKAIPNTVKSLDQKLNRGEVAELIWRYKTNQNSFESTNLENISNEIQPNETEIIIEEEIQIESTNTDEFKETKETVAKEEIETSNENCQNLGENIPSSINIDKVREAWLEWTNEVRVNEGLQPYTINPQLNRTATTWSEISKNRGYIDHKRDGQTAYYDYEMIQAWFKEQGLEFETISSHQFVENITWSTFTCTAEDCTDIVISHLKQYGFNFFMSEKGNSYDPHYRSIVSPYYKEIGMGLAVDPSNKYYFTIHYDTSIISDPLPICE